MTKRFTDWLTQQRPLHFVIFLQLIAVSVSELIVLVMSLLLHGEVRGDFLLTGFLTTTLTVLLWGGLVLRFLGGDLTTLRRFLDVELRQREIAHSLLHAALEATADAILVVDRAGRFSSYNRAFVTLWGMPEAMMRAGNDQAALAFVLDQLKDADGFLRKVTELYGQPNMVSHDVLEFKDGRIVERHSRPQYLHGDPVGRVWMFRDVTLQVNTLNQLESANALLQTVIDTIPIRVFWKDRDLRYLGCNSLFARDAGAESPTDIIGKLDTELSWKAQAELYNADDRAVMASGQPRHAYGEPQTTPTGEQIWLRTSKTPLHDVQHRVIGVLGVYDDVTEARRAEDALRFTQERLAFALQGASDGLWDWNLETDEVYYSPRWKSMLGYKEDELSHHLDTWKQLLHPDDAARSIQLLSDHLAGLTPNFESEYRMRHQDGHWVEILSRGTLARDADGRLLHPRRLVGTHVDITERRALLARENIYGAIVSQAADAIVLIDPETLGFPEFNTATHTALGYSHAEFAQLCLADVNPHFEAAEIRLRLRECIATGMLDIETQHRRKDGIWRDVFVTNRPVRVGERMFVAAIWHDITAQKQIERGLRMTALSLKQAQQVARLGIWHVNLDSGQVEWTDETYAIAGIPVGAPVTKEIYIGMVHPEDRRMVLATWARAVAAAPSIYDTQHRLMVHGDIRWIHERAELAAGADGRVTEVMGTTQDVTEQKRIEEKLRESESRFRSIAENTTDWLWSCDLQGRHIYSNKVEDALFGFPFNEVKDTLQLVHPDDVPLFEQTLMEAIRTCKGWQDVVIRWRCKNGEYRSLESSASPIFDAEGILVGFQGVDRDITHRLQAEEKLRESEFFLRQTQRVAQMGGWRADPVNDRVMWTEGVYDLVEMPYDYKPALKPTLDFYPPGSREVVVESFKRTLRSGEPFAIHTVLHTHSGKSLTVELRGSPHYAPDGHIDYLMGTIQDITDKMRDEAEHRRLQSQLQQAQKMEAIGQLTGGIAHDFNNILAAILGYTGLALERFVPDKQSKLADYLLEVQKAGERARDLIAKMLAFSRSHTGGDPKPMEAQTLVHEVVKMLAPAIPSSIQVETEIDAATALITMDAVDLHQMLTNLIINARDAVGDAGRIKVALRNVSVSQAECASCHAMFKGDYVELRVSDSGPGIPADIRHRVFDPFFTTKMVGKGSGMGLSVVHGLIHKYHGHLLLESSPLGSTFCLLIPATAAGTPTLEAEIAVTPSAMSAGGNVLVVDDERMLADMLGEVLEANGYHATVFTSSQDALTAFQLHPSAYDVLLTDQTMPEMSGDTLVQRILEIRTDLPVILCTGYSERVDKAVAEKLGIRYFFNKPATNEAILAALGTLMAEKLARENKGDPK